MNSVKLMQIMIDGLPDKNLLACNKTPLGEWDNPSMTYKKNMTWIENKYATATKKNRTTSSKLVESMFIVRLMMDHIHGILWSVEQ